MTRARDTRPPGAMLIRLLEPLVPRSHRDDWRAEWIAELAHSDLPPWRLRVRTFGALADALWLARHQGNRAQWSAALLAHDVRYAARTLLRRPAFTTIVVATLALCIGASSAVFGIVESVLLRGLSYRNLGAAQYRAAASFAASSSFRSFRRRFCSADSSSISGISTPTSRASSRTTSGNSFPESFCRKPNTSPYAPQP